MALDPLTLVTEIKPLLSPNLTGEQQQRFPFTQGQMLQGVIRAKGDAHQFILEINGHKITAESSSQLQVGQKLNLQVASLAPQIELQIVDSNPINRWLSNSIPLLGQQALLMPEVAVFAGNSGIMSQLGSTTQETLQLYATNMDGGVEDTFRTSKISPQLLDLAVNSISILPGQKGQVPYEKISELLQQFSRSLSLKPNVAQQAADLASLFARAADEQGQEILSRLTAGSPFAPATEEQTEAFVALLEKMAQQDPANKGALAQLLPLVKEFATLPTTHPVRQLFAFLINAGENESMPTNNQQATGRQMEDFFSRLGINMERLLAENKPEEAARTLKFALLELSQQAGSTDKSTVSPDQLAKTLELYQLLQIRLANESLYFLPLPFSFLEQGYLLVDTDRSRGQSEAVRDQASQTNQSIALHLQLEGLGNLQIDIHQKEDHVSLRFLTENAEKAKFVAEFREDLTQWITGGNLDSVQFLVGAKEPIKMLLEKIMSGGGMIDTRA
jgi:hypothetical protein